MSPAQDDALAKATSALQQAHWLTDAVQAQVAALDLKLQIVPGTSGLMTALRILVKQLLETVADAAEAADAANVAAFTAGATAAPVAEASTEAATSLSDDIATAAAMAHEAEAVISAAESHAGDEQLLLAALRLVGNLRTELIRCAGVAAQLEGAAA